MITAESYAEMQKHLESEGVSREEQIATLDAIELADAFLDLGRCPVCAMHAPAVRSVTGGGGWFGYACINPFCMNASVRKEA